tara:strand:+ start:250 stop:540 length:291 start_codon:yes stop_codon:yes gene_type:complete
MKKSNPKPNLKDLIKETNKITELENGINPNDLIEDANKIFSFIDKFEKIDYDNVDLNSLQKEVDNLESNLRNKYKDHLPKEEKPKKETKNNLDSKE